MKKWEQVQQEIVAIIIIKINTIEDNQKNDYSLWEQLNLPQLIKEMLLWNKSTHFSL